jgi:hypothetical protein
VQADSHHILYICPTYSTSKAKYDLLEGQTAINFCGIFNKKITEIKIVIVPREETEIF